MSQIRALRGTIFVLAGLICAALAIFATQSRGAQNGNTGIDLQPCRLEGIGGFRRIKAECGTLTVPLDPAKPDGQTIDLYVAKIPALTRTPASSAFTFIAGGPGQASTQGYVSMRGAFELIRREHDIILLDQRGTGRSSMQQCDFPEDRLIYDLDNWSSEEIIRYAKDCVADLSDDVRFYTTSIAVQDLDLLRATMGYSQLDLYGVSYGTRVAQHYLRRYPQHTRSVIIDGVVPVNLPLGPDIAINAQRSLDIVFARCDADSACVGSFGDIREKFAQLQRSLKSATVSVTLPDPISGVLVDSTLGYDHLLIAVRLMSYSPETVSLLPLMIDSAYHGNYQPLAAQALLSIENLTEMLAYGMHNTVVCTEDVPFFENYEIDREQLANSYMGNASLDGLIDTCRYWPRGPIDTDFKQTFSSTVPVLVLSGEDDPVTPAAYGEMAADYLGNARHISIKGQGHGQAHVGCIPRMMANFVEHLDVNALDTDCLDTQQAAPFFTSFSGPEP